MLGQEFDGAAEFLFTVTTLTTASSRPTIDVVVPAYNEADCIESCLDHVLAQDYPAERVRIVVVDAGSEDDTAELVRARAAREPRIRLVGGAARLNAGQAMAVGASAGVGELIARVDAHTYLAHDYLRLAANLLAQDGERLALVGGQPQQEGATPFGEAVAVARRSRFGVGGSVYADKRERAYVDSVQGGVYRRAALEAVGGFSADMLVSEDEELNWRLRQAGFTILLDTSLTFRYSTRSSWRRLFRQYRNYGRSRARVLAAHPDFLKPRHLVPPALTLTAASLLVAAPLTRGAMKALGVTTGAYCVAAGLAGASAAGPRHARLAARVAACFPAMHFGYGEGLLEEAAALQLARVGILEPPTVVTRR
jgi:succinoglycan biosynthesis protein ExoA